MYDFYQFSRANSLNDFLSFGSQRIQMDLLTLSGVEMTDFLNLSLIIRFLLK